MKEPKSGRRKILVAEGDVVSRRVLEFFLTRWGYEALVPENGEGALQLLMSNDAPRMVILDWMLPHLESVKICRRLRERERSGHPYTYVLVLSARSEHDDMLAALRSGADDYLAKPFDSREFHARLIVGQRIVDLQDELIDTREALRFRATHDPLTGALNRAEILDALEREEMRHSREGGCFAIAMLDIDHFKQVNDRFGHQAGDAVLQEVTRRISSCIRSYDMLGRYGGEEFLILIPSTDANRALSLAERVRTSIANNEVTVTYGSVCVSASVGLAVSVPGAIGETDRLLREADTALYRAKANGRNRCELAAFAPFPLSQEPPC
ncbi:MAG TPA: diguanylate cyclase [Candidatus Acidoferrum sp.]|nr:diguanylate cyclase [Candidatus Acidoferrum sp.]